MSLNMYLGETDTQVGEMNTICKEIIQSMEETKTSIASFMLAFTLKGKAYDSAKSFMAQTYFPLAQGIIYLCEELIQQNEGYPSDFRAEVAPTDVIEQEILDQIKVIEGIIARLRALSNTVPLLSVSIAIYEAMKRKLEEKLERLYTFNDTSSSNYEHAMDLAGEIEKGLTALENGKGFNSASGTFSTEGMDLDWATNIDKIHYEKLAHDLYPEYVDGSEKKLEKAIAIIKYEELNPEYVDQTNEFLSPLEEQDIVEIKFLMYTAEEPYRTLAMKYLDRFEIIILTPKIREKEKIDSDGVFRHKEDVIYVEVENLRKDDRGKYYTFFHEVAHAFDYYYGQDNKDILEEMMKQDGEKINESTFFTDGYRIDGKTLAERMYEDAGDNFRMELAKELESSDYNEFTSEEKQEMIENVTDNLLEQNKNVRNLSKEERNLQVTIQRLYKSDLLEGAAHNTASDVYGGVTNRVIEGSYWHEKDYWLNNDGSRKREPNREGFAEYYGRIMSSTDNNNLGVRSVEKFLAESKMHMDEIFYLMGRGLPK